VLRCWRCTRRRRRSPGKRSDGVHFGLCKSVECPDKFITQLETVS
jgi:hypothetical protein